jgi:hypothetical protein
LVAGQRWAAAALASVLLAVAGSRALGADEVRVSSRILPQGRIDETTQVRLIIMIEGTSVPDITTPRLPAMTNLTIAGGPQTSRSSSFSFENGRMSSSNVISLTYFLAPKGPGPAEVPSFFVMVGGTNFPTQAHRFQVETGRSGPAPPSGGNPRGRMLDEPETEPADAMDVFLQARVASPTVWVGQATTFEITLFAATPVNGLNWSELPSMTGLWVEDLPVDAGSTRRTVTLNNRQYNAYTVVRKTIVPTEPGTIAVPPFEAQVQAQRATRDPFGTFFGLGHMVHLLRRTNPVKIQAKPLPQENRPPDFSGAVGTYRMSASADRSTVNAGDAVAVRVTIEGNGSLQSADPPRLSAPPDVKVYDPKVVTEAAGGPDKLASKKTWEWVVVPLAPGTLAMPSPAFSYFDVATGGYKILRDELPAVTVNRGPVVPDSGVARGEVQANTKDIAFVKARRGALRQDAAPLHRKGWFVALAIAPIAAVPLGIYWGRRRERYLLDHGFARARRAARAAVKRLDRAAGKARTSSTAFHEDVAGALVDYVADRANRPASGLTYDQLDEILGEKGVDGELRRRYRACLEACDFARFVPDSGRPEARDQLVTEARSLIRSLEAVA